MMSDPVEMIYREVKGIWWHYLKEHAKCEQIRTKYAVKFNIEKIIVVNIASQWYQIIYSTS